MREIKFRAWHPTFGLMIYGISVDKKGWDDGVLKTMWGVSHEFIQQYTGLKDKKGQEIYEGDILRDNCGRKFEVFWMTGITEHDMEAGWWVRKHEGDCREVFTMHEWRDNKNLGQEVIGNIYENPELLKGEV